MYSTGSSSGAVTLVISNREASASVISPDSRDPRILPMDVSPREVPAMSRRGRAAARNALFIICLPKWRTGAEGSPPRFE